MVADDRFGCRCQGRKTTRPPRSGSKGAAHDRILRDSHGRKALVATLAGRPRAVSGGTLKTRLSTNTGERFDVALAVLWHLLRMVVKLAGSAQLSSNVDDVDDRLSRLASAVGVPILARFARGLRGCSGRWPKLCDAQGSGLGIVVQRTHRLRSAASTRTKSATGHASSSLVSRCVSCRFCQDIQLENFLLVELDAPVEEVWYESGSGQWIQCHFPACP